MEDQTESPTLEWEDWRGGECLLPSLVGKFYEQGSYTDVTFVLQDGSTIAVRTRMMRPKTKLIETGNCFNL